MRRSPSHPALVLAGFVFVVAATTTRAQDYKLDTFDRQQLTDTYYSEGICAGDLNGDGHVDLVYGPFWFAGPGFQEKHELYPPKPQNMEAYADHFFAWVHDFNGDGKNDILTAGFPGTPAYVYENPGPAGHDRHWPRHEVLNQVGNESPQFTSIVGDERPELVCSNDGFFGYATYDPAQPFQPWKFHAVSEKIAPIPFGHGLGVGDVNGDRRPDLLMKDGWFEQPATASDGPWKLHEAAFAPIGGADMFAYDVDGDGDNDVITSLAAHDFGLAWIEQKSPGVFETHVIMGDRPEANRYGLVFSEPHSVQIADIDGDGLNDIVTGKTYYSHHKQSPMWDAGAVVYWFKLVRRPGGGIDWVPYRADGEAGIGRQLLVCDINKDGLLDLASGGMKGAHVLIHKREAVDKARWDAAQPKPIPNAASTEPVRGKPLAIDPATGRVRGVIEAESIAGVAATAGKVGKQEMQGFKSGVWSGNAQLLWSGAKPGDRLEIPFETQANGPHELSAAWTLARDYATVRLTLDGRPFGDGLDLYQYPDVLSSGEVVLGTASLEPGQHRLGIEIVGAHPSAVRGYLVGLDFLRVERK